MTDSQIKQIIDLTYNRETKDIYNIYHYTTTDVSDLILKEDNVYLKMTHIDNFDDKLEGKTIDDFYNTALEKLLAENEISESQYKLLIEIKTPQKNVTVFEEEKNVYRGELTESDVYITCFSKEKNDPYMIENYIKNDNHSGYCLDFSCCELESNEITYNCFGTGFSFKMLVVKYGEQAVREIYNFLKKLLEIFNGCDDEIEKNSIGLIKSKLNELKYATKLNDYRKENEVRLMLVVPKGHFPYVKMQNYFEQSVSNKEADNCIIKLPKYFIHGINKSPNLSDVDDKNWREIFKQRGYRFLY